MSDRTRDSVGACENPEPESDGARRHDGDNVTDERDQGQSDEPEGEVHRNEVSQETDGLRGEDQGYSEHPEGCEAQAVPVLVGHEQSSPGSEWVGTGQNGAADSNVFVNAGTRDKYYADGAESVNDGQDSFLVAEASDGCRHSETKHGEVTSSHSVRERPEAGVDSEGSMDENLQAIGSDETEDNVEGLYREGGLGDLSNSNSNTESLGQHQGNSFEEAAFNDNVTAEAESTEDDIFAEVSNNDVDVENIGENVMVQVPDAHVPEAECAEADNGTNDWMQELSSDDSSESAARADIEPVRIETVAPSEDVQVNSSCVESDGHPAECVTPGDNESLSESDPEENACDQNMCNDSVEADSSQNIRLQESGARSEDIQASAGDGIQNRLAEADSVEASGEADQEEMIDSVPHAEATGSSHVPNCAGESVGQDGVFSNLDGVLNNSITSAESSSQEAHASPERVDPPRGDICHASGTPEAGSPGDEPEDSDVSRPDLQPNNMASDTDLYAPECDRAQTSANQPVHDTPDSDVGEVEVQENAESQASGDGGSDDASSAEDSDVPASLPPCQQGSFHMEDVDLRSDQLCSGISGSDLGEDFLRSADMLQSLTESKSCGSEKNEEEDFQTESSNCEDNDSSSHSTDLLSGQQVNQTPSSDASESETNMLQIHALQASAVAACALQDSNLTNDCVPHSSRDSCSEHSNSDSSSIENLPCVIALTDNECESSIVNKKFESIQGSSGVSACVGDVTGDDDLLTELDAELEANSVSGVSVTMEDMAHCDENDLISESTQLSEPINGLRAMPAVALCELSEDKLRQLLGELQSQLSKKDSTIKKLQNDKALQAEKLQYVVFERDTYLKQLEASKSKQQADDLYLPQIKELEYTISQQQNENRGLKDKLASHDAAAKRAVTSLQNELKLRVDQVTKMYEDCRKEKDSMVMKYAQAEHKNIELQRATEKAEGRLKEILKEREIFLTKARQLKADYQRTCSELETTTAELALATTELDKHKELVTSAEVRIKWAQNKMKAELESHKETKKELDKSNAKIKEAKEETSQIRRDCQAIIKTYQESEEMKSSTLDQRLKKKETELIQEKQEKTDQGEVYHAVLKELETLKVQYKDNMEELKTYRDKVRAQESERLTNEETMTKYKDIIQNQKKENRDLQAKIDKLFYIQSDFDRAQDMIKSLDADIRDLKLSNKELQSEIESCRKRESHLLELTKKLTSKNAQLQSENTNLNGKVLNLSSDNQKKAMQIQEFETKLANMSDNLNEEIKARKDETEKLKENLLTQTKSSEDFSRLVDEQRDEMKTLKRKHANNVKDLTRQLQQARRKLESIDAKGDNKESMSMGSRTSSNGSLNTPQGDVNGGHTNPTPKAPIESPPQEYPVIVEQVEIDRQVLIDRIVKLQKAHARKNEKIEFMEDHIKQLVVEVKKKKRIIQHYVLREEAGALSTENMDLNKVELSKRGGIMASVYSSHASDSHMSLELSLEINKKLQSVLEDTLLKNITLKENIDTLGEEIARLSQENRRLQLSIQGLS